MRYDHEERSKAAHAIQEAYAKRFSFLRGRIGRPGLFNGCDGGHEASRTSLFSSDQGWDAWDADADLVGVTEVAENTASCEPGADRHR